MNENNELKCTCFTCRHHDEPRLIKAYYEGFIEASKWFLNWAKRNRIEPGSISDDDLPGIVAQMQCNLDETQILLNELNEKQDDKETIIKKSEHDELMDKLIEDSKMLEALEACGVDNWEGYDEALEYLEDMEKESE